MSLPQKRTSLYLRCRLTPNETIDTIGFDIDVEKCFAVGNETGVRVSEGLVVQERAGGIAHVVLNRPGKRNAADREMQQALVDVLREVSADDDVRAIVLSGRGPALSAGGDRALLDQVVAGESPDLEDELLELTRELLWLMLDEVRQPIVVAVQGYAIGWGAGLVALGDFVVMEDDAYLQEPHGLHGLSASPGCELVWSRFVPPAVLKEWLVLGRPVSGREASRWGLVNSLVPSGLALVSALRIAEQLAEAPAAGAAAAKRGVNRAVVDALGATWPQPAGGPNVAHLRATADA
jgi:enoyl-CoA hydratase